MLLKRGKKDFYIKVDQNFSAVLEIFPLLDFSFEHYSKKNLI